jgi:hypothetical protein
MLNYNIYPDEIHYAKGTYLVFYNSGPRKGQKTNVYDVYAGTSVKLGLIKWYAPWRKYSYFPNLNTVYEQVCLREIAEFCEIETRKRKEKNKNVDTKKIG